MPKLRFVRDSDIFATDVYYSTDAGELMLYQPAEFSTGMERFRFDIKNDDLKKSISLNILSEPEKESLKNFFFDVVNGMAKTFTLIDYASETPYTFDSTEYTFDSTLIAFDAAHVVEESKDYRFNQLTIEFVDNSGFYSTSFELLGA